MMASRPCRLRATTPRDLAMPDDEDSDSGSSVGMPTLEDQDAPVFRPPPPPINDILGPTTEETDDSEEYTDEEEADDDVDVEEVERGKRYERALAKFPYQGDLGRAVRARPGSHPLDQPHAHGV